MARMMTSEEAASRLGIKVTTLYVYVSRGLLESHPDPASRRSLFAVEDVERLATRSRSGRRVESRLAVVTTSITLLDERGPVYRGRPATELARSVPFERVADLLWGDATAAGDEVAEDPDWSPRPLAVPAHLRARDRLPWATVMSGAEDPFRADLRPTAVARAARRLVATLVAAMGAQTTSDTPPSNTPASDATASDTNDSDTNDSDTNDAPDLVLANGTRVRGSVAGRLTAALSPRGGIDASNIDAGPGPGRGDRAEVVAAVNAAMVLLADHELATSTLAVRVAASTRADVYDAVLSGLGTSAGTLHSAASDVALELLRAAGSDGAEVAMGDALRRWGHVPGFGHGAYPDGDPRATCLLEIVAGLGDDEHGALAQRLIDTAAQQGLPPANIDFALAALASAIGARPGAMPALFSIARVAGWVAHYLEELEERPLRFRARAIHATESG